MSNKETKLPTTSNYKCEGCERKNKSTRAEYKFKHKKCEYSFCADCLRFIKITLECENLANEQLNECKKRFSKFGRKI